MQNKDSKFKRLQKNMHCYEIIPPHLSASAILILVRNLTQVELHVVCLV